jgi:hypothetical protein
MSDLEKQLNAPGREERLAALRALAETPAGARLPGNVNNHIHTTYSFSPYSPAMAMYRARQAGLVTAGIMDHDTMAGAEEFLEAGRILGMAATCGIECRADFTGTPFGKPRINNPDQSGVIYMSLHGVPRRALPAVQAFFAPYREARLRRDRLMAANIDGILEPFGMRIDFERDVLPLSMAHDGGTVTERHLVMALCNALIGRFGRGAALLGFAEGKLGLTVPEKLRALLADGANPYYAYDLLGAFKGGFVSRFYVDAAEECPKAADVLELARSTGSISAYPYLGDVGDSVTGDKRAQKFEDGFLDELMRYLKDMGFMAVTYMPTRNTRAQLRRVRALCTELGFFEISGEDINSPRQSFVCEALKEPEFENLVESTWALIAHERLSDRDISLGMFSEETIRKYPGMDERVKAFAAIGRQMHEESGMHIDNRARLT